MLVVLLLEEGGVPQQQEEEEEEESAAGRPIWHPLLQHLGWPLRQRWGVGGIISWHQLHCHHHRSNSNNNNLSNSTNSKNLSNNTNNLSPLKCPIRNGKDYYTNNIIRQPIITHPSHPRPRRH